jgi:hypothetical protein
LQPQSCAKLPPSNCTNPINGGNDNNFQVGTDYVGTGALPLTFQRDYNSAFGDPVEMGLRWRHSYERHLRLINFVNNAHNIEEDSMLNIFSSKTMVNIVGVALVVLILDVLTSGIGLGSTIQLPQTGQTQCYDFSGNVISCVGTGQDPEFPQGVV